MVRAQRDGFFGPPPLGNSIGTSPTARTTVTIGASQEKRAEAHLDLVQGSTLSGRVRSPEGKALVGAEVYAYQITYPNGRVALNSVSSKTADDRGEFVRRAVKEAVDTLDEVVSCRLKPRGDDEGAGSERFEHRCGEAVTDARRSLNVERASEPPRDQPGRST